MYKILLNNLLEKKPIMDMFFNEVYCLSPVGSVCAFFWNSDFMFTLHLPRLFKFHVVSLVLSFSISSKFWENFLCNDLSH